MKPLLLISQHAPWSGLNARETLDIALAGGAFDLPVSLLWRGEGVYQLLAGQQPALLEQKNLQSQLASLPLFGVDALYVCRRSLEARGIDASQLALAVNVLDTAAIRELLAGHAQVLVI
ncbi:MAG: sulfurtransferase complex subunit TusC [Thiopseudomonas sp.]|nr:sulfurtransferase complex subunit TusC [Thiopseudomonas sp.]